MQGNPYYVKGGGDFGKQLSGISNIVSGVREQKRGRAGEAALQEAYKTRDPEAINQVLIDHPELIPKVKKMDELGRMMKKDNILSIALGADQALNIQDPFERQAFLVNRKNEIDADGGRNSSETDFLIGLPMEEQTQALQGLVEHGRNFAGYGGGSLDRARSVKSSQILSDGTTVQVLNSGATQVTDPEGNQLTGKARSEAITAANNEGIRIQQERSRGRAQGVADVKAETEPDIQKAIALSKFEGTSLAEDQELLRSMESSMPRLREVTTTLKSLVNDASFTLAGKAWNEIAKQSGFSTEGGTARVRMEAIADNEVLPLLKQTFGAAFTAEEGNRLRATLVNPDATPDAKMATLEAFIDSKEGQIKSLQSKASGLPAGVTEEDISFTMNKHGISREEVLQKMR